jgi:5-bromo-4-chloroindolyl phosphate hydrolysis protein
MKNVCKKEVFKISCNNFFVFLNVASILIIFLTDFLIFLIFEKLIKVDLRKNEAECYFSDRESAKRFLEKFNRFLNLDFFN